MRSIPVTINIPVRDIAQAMASELGLVPVKLPKIARSGGAQAMPAFDMALPTIDRAIEDVIQATNRLDRDQYTSAAGAAQLRLFETAKRLRRAVLEARAKPSN